MSLTVRRLNTFAVSLSMYSSHESQTMNQTLEWARIPFGIPRYKLGVPIPREFSSGPTFTTASLVLPFTICETPVLNWQYQQFLDAPDGYRNKTWWSFHQDALKNYLETPAPARLEKPDDPRTDVSFWDAMAYTRWLSSKLGYNVTLPRPGQWVQAFNHRQKERITYPEFDPYPLYDVPNSPTYTTLWEWCISKPKLQRNFGPWLQPVHTPDHNTELIGLAREKHLGFRLIKGR
ncbi:MAG: SUMF1/EgtB/PvdO family nonheme iron enzyme [Anaerolineae bacterium]